MLIGAGASALATLLFTQAFRLGDPITPQVLQKLQPLIAVLLATVILGERLRPRFALFLVPGLVGACGVISEANRPCNPPTNPMLTIATWPR